MPPRIPGLQSQIADDPVAGKSPARRSHNLVVRQPQNRRCGGHQVPLGQQHCPNVTCQILATETSVRLSLNSLSDFFRCLLCGAGRRRVISEFFLAFHACGVPFAPTLALAALLLWRRHVGGCPILVASRP
jgi:hypothetical protein